MGKYYLGLDIGTDSVGYAVTDENYNLKKVNGRPAWGSMIFDAASDNAERRSFRSGRRRLDRRQQRVQFVQELLAPEIAKVDENFFKRIQASALFREDTDYKYSIFEDDNFTDVEYYKQYPTIHHLITELMDSNEKHDIRLIYIACAWLVAHRGHFLSNIDKSQLDSVKDFGSVYNNFIEFFTNAGYETPWKEIDCEKLGNCLKSKQGVIGKNKELISILYQGAKPGKEASEEFPFSREAIVKLLAGGTVKLADLFCNEEYADKGSVALSLDDDKMGEIMAEIGEDFDLISAMRAIYDWTILVDTLGQAKTISEAKVRIFEIHKADLAYLKAFVKKYIPEKYDLIFRKLGKDNYPAYVYHTDEPDRKNLKKKNKEDFSKFVLSLVRGIDVENGDLDAYNDMISRLENNLFLPKQKNTDNRVIPHQLYWHELHTLLNKSAEYTPYLNETDSDGLSVKEKIESVFLYRIPYFVGPLNTHSDYSWVVRSAEKIYPWNFTKVVDLDASEQAFITKLTNTCTYLPGETVLPKDSLCYHKYTVLNEINNIRINGIKPDVSKKQALYNDLFMNVKKVTRKKLVDYLICNGLLNKGEEEALSGIDITINSNLTTQIAFKRLLESGTLNEDEVEKIVERASYAEDKSRLKRWLDVNFANLSDEDKKYICSIKLKDFGRLSRKFLTGIEGICKETGEVMTIMSALWNTNDNLMELLSDKYTFADEIQAYVDDYYSLHKVTLADKLEDMYIPNAVKRPIYRTLSIVDDVVKAFGNPEKIFIEVTRGGTADQKGKRTSSRRQQILDLYALCKDEEVKILKKQLEDMGELADNKLQSDKLFLYYIQLGKCMYSGAPLELEKLATKEYDIDHIYPQAFVKDDSIINNKVLVLSKLNGEKSDTYPISADIRNKMTYFWENLRKIGLISEEKYKRLVRKTPFTEDEKYGFINRQLTETSQSTKAVAILLKERFENVEVVYSKAGLVSDFRHEFEIYKSRLFNDLHHAVDAYLNIVVGNVYSMKFSKRWFAVSSNYSIKTRTIFTHPLICSGRTVWDGETMLAKVKKTAVRNDAHFTKYAFFKTGGFFDQMPVEAGSGLVPRKKGLSTEKYGGYNKSSVMFFIPVKYTEGKKTDVMIMSVELMHGKKFLENEQYALEYSAHRLEHILGKAVKDISFPLGLRPLKVNTVLSLDGFRVCITGSAGGGRCLCIQPIMQFVSGSEWICYLKKLEKFVEKVKNNSKYIYDEAYDKISTNLNETLYSVYIDKLKNSIYSKRVNNPIAILVENQERFSQLSIFDQAICLLNIHSVFCRMSNGCDLSLLGGGTRAAATVSFSTKISNWKNYSDIRIVDMSPSGIWEKKSENLLELV